MKQRIAACFLFLTLLLTMGAVCVRAVDTATPLDSAEDLLLIAQDPDGSFALNADIQIPDAAYEAGGIFEGGFAPVASFTGTLEGNDRTIQNLRLIGNSADRRVALFENNSGTIRNLTLEAVSVTATLIASEQALYANGYVAGLVARNAGSVAKCAVTGTLSVSVSGNTFTAYVGGIAAENTGTISNCFANCTVSGNTDNTMGVYAGGLVGQNNSGMLNTSLSLSTVTAASTLSNENLYAGGAVGYNRYGQLNCVYSAADGGQPVGKQQVQPTATDVYAALDSTALIAKESFVNFDFDSVWQMGDSHPVLRTAEPVHTHTPGKWVTTKAATFFSAGSKTLYCAACPAAIKTQVIPKLQGTDTLTVFKDIKKSDWFVQNGAIDFAYNMDLFKGTSSTTFGPNENMNRAMFVTVLGRLNGAKVNHKQATKFTDVKTNQYYTGYVRWAAANGIVNGTGDTTFSPDANITREQICAMMVRYASYANIKLKKVNAAITFKDAGKISGYAKSAVTACQRGGIVGGKGNGIFDPMGNATRAEVATILMNFYSTYIP